MMIRCACAAILAALFFMVNSACPKVAQSQEDTPDLDTMIGQMLLVGFRGTDYSDQGVHYILEDIRAGRVGGVILFSKDAALLVGDRNIQSPEQVHNLTALLSEAAPLPLFIAADQEGGRVNRFKPDRGFPETVPSARTMGTMGDSALTRSYGASTGLTLAGAGLNLDFAPVVDVDVYPESPAIGALERSFSPNPEMVAAQGAAFVDGLHDAGILSCLKHFPGHGSARGDTHKGVTDVTTTWSEQELIPYTRLIGSGHADMVMTAHIVNQNLDPEYPASLSHAVTTNLLRHELGFTGVIITDDLQMGAIQDQYSLDQTVALAVQAGADILLFGNNLEYDPEVAAKAHAMIKAMVLDGSVAQERIHASYERIMALKSRLASGQ